MLQPIEPAKGAEKGKMSYEATDSCMLTWRTAEHEAKYPLTGLMSLLAFNRLIYLRPSGIISDSGQLDLLFTLPMDTPILGISSTSHKENEDVSIVIMQPSAKSYTEIVNTISAEDYSDTYFLKGIQAMTDFAEDQVHLVAKTSSLRLEDDVFSVDEYLENTAYIQLSDPELPGPEYDIPPRRFLSAKPTAIGPGKAWERSYEIFRERRMDVCGLDLEPLEGL